jgi:hypothetical protein
LKRGDPVGGKGKSKDGRGEYDHSALYVCMKIA